MAAVAQLDDSRWSQLQGNLDRLCTRLGLIYSSQQLVLARLGEASKAMEQFVHDQRAMGKKLEAMGCAVARLSPPQRSAMKCLEENTPLMGGRSSGVLLLSPNARSAHKVFDEMLLKDNATGQTEQMVFSVPLLLESAATANELLGGTPKEDVASNVGFGSNLDLHGGLLLQQLAWSRDSMEDVVVKWDDELQDDNPSHDGLLKQLAGWVDIAVDDEQEQIAKLDVSAVQTQNKATQLSMDHCCDSADAMVSALPSKMVIWDESLSDCDTHVGLLQQLAMGAEYSEDEATVKSDKGMPKA